MWDNNVLLAVVDDGGVVKASVMRGIDQSDALDGGGGVGGAIAVNLHTNGLHFCVHDGNENIVGLTKGQDGKSGGIYEYDPFGKTLRLTGSAAKENTIRFSGQYCDEISGGAKYLHRDYEPHAGRWRTRDPISEQGGMNMYAFVDNNPIAKWDYLGLTAHLSPLNGGVDNRSSVNIYLNGDWSEIAMYNGHTGNHYTVYPWSAWQRWKYLNSPPLGHHSQGEEQPGGTHVLSPGRTSAADWRSGATRIVDVDEIIGAQAGTWIFTSRCCCGNPIDKFRIHGTTVIVRDCPGPGTESGGHVWISFF